MHTRRARLEITVVALGVLLLGLVPYPRAFTTAMRQGEAHRRAREYSDAVVAFQQAADLDPESPHPWLQTGHTLLEQLLFSEATSAFQQAERRGEEEAAILGLGECYAGLGDWAAAIQTWYRLRVLAPGDARVYIALGRGSLAQGLLDQAEGYLAQALELHPKASDAVIAHALLGRLLVADDPDLAAGHFHEAGDRDMLAVLDTVAAEPDPAHQAVLLGAAFLQRDELTLAHRHFERAVLLMPDDADALAYLAHTFDRLGKTGAAREMLEQAIAMDPSSILPYYFLGIYHRRVGYAEGAQAALWEALLRDPENAALRVEMAQTFLDLRDYPHAEEWYRAAVEVAPDDLEFHLMLVRFFLDHLYRVEEGGVPAAEAAVALAPDDARVYDLLGWAYHLAGRPTEGQQALNQALALDPDLVSAYYHLGSLHATMGRRKLANLNLQRAVDLDRVGSYRARAQALLSDLD
jgi:tetratricopeptide (TPR) repeat protein